MAGWGCIHIPHIQTSSWKQYRNFAYPSDTCQPLSLGYLVWSTMLHRICLVVVTLLGCICNLSEYPIHCITRYVRCIVYLYKHVVYLVRLLVLCLLHTYMSGVLWFFNPFLQFVIVPVQCFIYCTSLGGLVRMCHGHLYPSLAMWALVRKRSPHGSPLTPSMAFLVCVFLC
jgi:hypothetical protein